MIKLKKSINSKMPFYFAITKYLELGTLEARKGCLHLGWGGGKMLAAGPGFQLCHIMAGRDNEGTAAKGAVRKQGNEGVEEAGLAHFIQTCFFVLFLFF